MFFLFVVKLFDKLENVGIITIDVEDPFIYTHNSNVVNKIILHVFIYLLFNHKSKYPLIFHFSFLII